jgi:hypothetical protein
VLTRESTHRVSMLQETIAEMREFLNDPDLKTETRDTDASMLASAHKDLETEKRSVVRL